MGISNSKSSSENIVINHAQLDSIINELYQIIKIKMEGQNGRESREREKNPDFINYYTDLLKIKRDVVDSLPERFKKENTKTGTREPFNPNDPTEKYNNLLKGLIKKRIIYRLGYLYLNLHITNLNSQILVHLRQTDQILNKVLQDSSKYKTTNANLYKQITDIVSNIDKDFVKSNINIQETNNDVNNIIRTYTNKINELKASDIQLKNIPDFSRMVGGSEVGTTIENTKIGSIDSFLDGFKKDYSFYKQAERLSKFYTEKIIKIINLYFTIYKNLVETSKKTSDGADIEAISKAMERINGHFEKRSINVDLNQEYLRTALQRLLNSINVSNDILKKEFIDKVNPVMMNTT